MLRPFKTGESLEQVMERLRTELRRRDSAVHIRVRGEAGVGKTRLVLEGTRAPGLSPLVAYFNRPSAFLDGSMLSSLLRADNRYCVIAVVDECDLDSSREIWNRVHNLGPRLKFVSIYNAFQDTSGSTVFVDAPHLAEEQISAIFQAYDVPKDYADRLAPDCGGFPRMAHIVGQNMKEHPDDILLETDTSSVWNRFVGSGFAPANPAVEQRWTVLRHLALFKRFGYEGPVRDEAREIWNIIHEDEPGISWGAFQSIIADLRDLKVLQGVTTLYISPGFFHLKLWTEWFRIHGHDFSLVEFQKRLSPALLDWFREMYQYARESPEAIREVRNVLDENGPFADADFFLTRDSSEFFLRLTDAAPDAALRRAQSTFQSRTVDELRAFGEGRRNLLWALERMVVWRELFADSARLLLRLAEAENEDIANNATGVFAGLFSPGQGRVAPTEASPEERFPILVEAIDSDSKEQRKIALLACNGALETGFFSRFSGAEYQGLRQPPNLWVPETWGEIFDAYRRVWRLLESRLEDLEPEERDQAANVLLERSRGLSSMANLVPMVVDTLSALLKRPWMDHRLIIDVVEDFFRYKPSELDAKMLRLWEELRAELAPVDFHTRMERYVGMDRFEDSIDSTGQEVDHSGPAIQALAAEGAANPAALQSELAWLVTEEAKNGFRYGYELGKQDPTGSLLLDVLTAQRSAAAGGTAFFLAGYLRALHERDRDAYEALLDDLVADRELSACVPELSWRAGLTDRGAIRILALAQTGAINEHTFRMFAYGGGIRDISPRVFQEWVEHLIQTDTRASVSIGLDLLFHYYLMPKPTTGLPEQPTLALLTSRPFFVSSDQETVSEGWNWNEVASALVTAHPEHALELGKTLLAHFGVERSVIGVFHSPALNTLNNILKDHAEELWGTVVNYLGPPIDSRAFKIQHWLRDGALLHVPAQLVWDWIEGDVEKRAWYAANMVPKVFPGGTDSCSARELLVRYGDR